MRARSTAKRVKPSDIFLPRGLPQPTERASKRRRPQPDVGGGGGWFRRLFRTSSTKATAALGRGSDGIDGEIDVPESRVRRRRVARHHDSMRSVVEQEELSHSSLFEMTWSALFPTTHCKCCTLPAGHFYAQKCANITYKKFNPADLSCYNSVYGSDGAVVYWSRLLDDVRHYIGLTRILEEKTARNEATLRIWDEVMRRAEKKLRKAESVLFGGSVDLPLQAGKCCMIKVPAPLEEGEDGWREERKRTIWVRCKTLGCSLHGLSVAKEPKGPTTKTYRCPSPRRVFEIRIGLGEGRRLIAPARISDSRKISPLRDNVVMDEVEDEEIEVLQDEVEEDEAEEDALYF